MSDNWMDHMTLISVEVNFKCKPRFLFVQIEYEFGQKNIYDQ